MPSSVDNCPLLGKQLVACYWAPGETGRLSTGHYVATPREPAIMTWVLSDLPSHKAGHAQQHSAIAWERDALGKASPEGTSCLCRWLRCPGPRSRDIAHPHLRPRGSSLSLVDTGIKNPSLVDSWSARHAGTTQEWTAGALQPHSGAAPKAE